MDRTLLPNPIQAFLNRLKTLELRAAVPYADKNSIGNVAYPDYAQKVRCRNLFSTLACYALCRRPADNNAIEC